MADWDLGFLYHINRIAENPAPVFVQVISIGFNPVSPWFIYRLHQVSGFLFFLEERSVVDQANVSLGGQTDSNSCAGVQCDLLAHGDAGLIIFYTEAKPC